MRWNESVIDRTCERRVRWCDSYSREYGKKERRKSESNDKVRGKDKTRRENNVIMEEF